MVGLLILHIFLPWSFKSDRFTGHRSKTHQYSYIKDPTWFTRNEADPPSIVAANGAEHSRLRYLLSHTMSHKSVQLQEPLICGHIYHFIEQLRNLSTDSTSVDMTRWFFFASFDIIGDLTFGESFGCLSSGVIDPYLKELLDNTSHFVILQSLCRLPGVKLALFKLMSYTGAMEGFQRLAKVTHEKVVRRLSKKVDREDFMTHFSRVSISADSGKAEDRLSLKEIETSMETFILAGTDTTATLLTGCTFHLLENMGIRKKLTQEIRAAFSADADITSQALQRLPYLEAVLKEALRIYPPFPTTFPRRVPLDGGLICGQFVPGGTTVGVNHWAASQCSRNFSAATEFIPERWLDESLYQDEDKRASQPFSIGPQNCLGKNLAYAEMRLMMAHLLWNFDMEIDGESRNWLVNQKVFVAWEKPPLKVKLINIRQ